MVRRWAAGAMAIGVAALPAAPADAAPYVFSACALPDGRKLSPLQDWSYAKDYNGSSVWEGDRCGKRYQHGGFPEPTAFNAMLSDTFGLASLATTINTPERSLASWTASVPPGLAIVGGQLLWSGDVEMTGFFESFVSGTAAVDLQLLDGVDGAAPSTVRRYAITVDGLANGERRVLHWGTNSDTYEGDPVVQPLDGARHRTVRILGDCTITAGGGRSGGSCYAHTLVRRAELRIDDALPPAATAGGSAFADGPVGGVVDVEVDAKDVGGGLAGAVLRVDGADAPLAASPALPAACVPAQAVAGVPVYTRAVPCPAERTFLGTLDTSRLADGRHRLEVLVRDAAGNETTVRSATIDVRNAAPAGPAGLRSGDRPSGVLELRRPPAGLPYGRRPAVTGRLLGPDRRGLRGIRLTVETRTLLPGIGPAPGGWTAQDDVLTTADGTFRAVLPAGPSRVVRVRWTADGQDVATAEQRLAVRAGATAVPARRRLRNGGEVVVTGRVVGPLPASGVGVALQVRTRGRWLTVPTQGRRAGARGRFRLAYRFRRTFRPTRYRMRVAVSRDSGYPYLEGSSRSFTVTVRP